MSAINVRLVRLLSSDRRQGLRAGNGPYSFTARTSKAVKIVFRFIFLSSIVLSLLPLRWVDFGRLVIRDA